MSRMPLTAFSTTQCAIPAFENLLPEPHNEMLMALLFICAQWHALAKLRLHHDLTLALLDYTTTHLGAQTRRFYRDTCMKIPTKELSKEAEARARRSLKEGNGKASASQRLVTLNVFTIKFHFLGDYSSVIRRLGTTESYSTQTVSRPDHFVLRKLIRSRESYTTEFRNRGILGQTRKTMSPNSQG